MGFGYRLRFALGILFDRPCAVTWRGTQKEGGMFVVTFGDVYPTTSSHYGSGRTTHTLSDGTHIEVKS
jgi:hypothetical protein